jgi:hypothetical protein
MQTGCWRGVRDELHAWLRHRPEVLTNLVDGRLRDLADEPLVLPRCEQARDLSEGMHVSDDHREPQRSAEPVGQRERVDRAL